MSLLELNYLSLHFYHHLLFAIPVLFIQERNMTDYSQLHVGLLVENGVRLSPWQDLDYLGHKNSDVDANKVFQLKIYVEKRIPSSA